MRRSTCRILTAVALAWGMAAGDAAAQSVSVDLGAGGTVTGQLVRLVLLITILSLAPSILVMITSFTRVVVVLAFLRSALGLQQTPPNAVLISLALFVTAFIMAPTLEQAYREGLAPLLEENINERDAFERAIAPFRDFMLAQVRAKGSRAVPRHRRHARAGGSRPCAAAGADPGVHDQRAAPRLRDRLLDLRAVPGHRHGGRLDP